MMQQICDSFRVTERLFMAEDQILQAATLNSDQVSTNVGEIDD